MEVRMCDMCKKILPEIEIGRFRDVFDSRMRYCDYDLCQECYEKADALMKEYKEKDDKTRDQIYAEYLEKKRELGLDIYDKERSD